MPGGKYLLFLCIIFPSFLLANFNDAKVFSPIGGVYDVKGLRFCEQVPVKVPGRGSSLTQYTLYMGRKSNDFVLRDLCDRGLPPTIFHALKPDYGYQADTVWKEEHKSIEVFNAKWEQNIQEASVAQKEIYKIVDWLLIQELNQESFVIFEEFKNSLNTNLQGVKSEIARLMLKKKLSDSEKLAKSRIMKYKYKVKNLLQTASIPMIWGFNRTFRFHPFFNQIILESLANDIPFRHLGDSKSKARKIRYMVDYISIYFLKSVEGMSQEIVDNVRSIIRESDLYMIENNWISENSVLNGLEENDWRLVKGIINSFYLLSAQKFNSCSELGLWPAINRSLFTNSNPINSYFFIETMTPEKIFERDRSRRFDNFRNFDLYYSIWTKDEHNFIKRFIDSVEDLCGEAGKNTIFSNYTENIRGLQMLVRHLFNGSPVKSKYQKLISN